MGKINILIHAIRKVRFLQKAKSKDVVIDLRNVSKSRSVLMLISPLLILNKRVILIVKRNPIYIKVINDLPARENLVFTWSYKIGSFSDITLISDYNNLREVNKNVKVKYDYAPGLSTLTFPYQIHYWLYIKYDFNQIYELRNRTRKTRLLFSGNSNTNSYGSDIIRSVYKKQNRSEILKTYLECVEKDFNVDEFYQFMEDSDYYESININREQGGIKSRLWLEALALSDFFLCPPGVIMPMCHNIIETMAVGTIPVTNYPEWFNPPLKDGINCFVFNSQNELTDKIDQIKKLNLEEIKELRKNVIEYYDLYLDPFVWYKNEIFNTNKNEVSFSLLDENLDKIKAALKSIESNG